MSNIIESFGVDPLQERIEVFGILDELTGEDDAIVRKDFGRVLLKPVRTDAGLENILANSGRTSQSLAQCPD